MGTESGSEHQRAPEAPGRSGCPGRDKRSSAATYVSTVVGALDGLHGYSSR